MQSQRPRALIVDDNVFFARELRAFLSSEGWEAEVANHALHALGVLKKGPAPQLVLLDLDLPDISGWGIYGELLLNPSFPKVPVLIVSRATWLPQDVPLTGIVGMLETPTSPSAWEHFRGMVRPILRNREEQLRSETP
ncbi:response regulator [Pyxidicoccus fallax]|uniref:Response regulator n=1 Tax=Pyxidicoccus fallax TaxID=394095 RepID=A0A848LW58_9BACT|nr:response regulator [Pyxidicoccus fallax]NMO22328.1 response regulator [Pyxidicoccus fallax]NPC84032.1 response regulator [Pyxidicoccus fallax]